MMKKGKFISVNAVSVVLLLLAANVFATISYQLEQFGGTRWGYNYQIHNDQPVPIEALTIWFDNDLYSDLQIESSPQVQADWDEDFLLGVPGLGDGYDIFSGTLGIGLCHFADGFSISFNWHGTGIPGDQSFEIVDPATFETTHRGRTIPEPATLSLMLGVAILLRGRKK